MVQGQKAWATKGLIEGNIKGGEEGVGTWVGGVELGRALPQCPSFVSALFWRSFSKFNFQSMQLYIYYDWLSPARF